MCRYAAPYKPHFACFSCRKGFKRRLKGDVDPRGDDHPARCPQCRGEMANMGLDFAPPPMRDVKAWKVVASLWSLGLTWHSCGCSGPGYRPRSPRDHRDFLARRRDEYAGHLARWKAQPPDHPQRSEALVHWSARLQAIEEAIREAV